MNRILLIFLMFLPISAFADIASVEYVENKTANQVKTIGTQEISGTKTYTTSPIVPTPPLPEPEA